MSNISRREFGAYALFFTALFGAGAFAAPKLYSKNTPLRPPGALDEKEFLATCIKCGQCVQVCPYHSLFIFDITDLNSIGTPYVDAKKRGCYLCDLFPCILACPTGSLAHEVTTVDDIHMGTAIVKNIDACLAYKKENVKGEDIATILTHSNQNEREEKILNDAKNYIGKECSICVDMCPYPNKEEAITMLVNEQGLSFPKINDKCVGCGVCAELCPVSIIEIIPRYTHEEVYK